MQDPTREGKQFDCEGVVSSTSPVKDPVHLTSHHRQHQSSTLWYINSAMTSSMTAGPNDVPMQTILPRRSNEGKSSGGLLGLCSFVQDRSFQLGPLTQSSRYMYQASQHGTSLTTMVCDADSTGNSDFSAGHEL
ncbi:hypothetical protein VitviT2T_018088 [Vitis vinifera]|uniref:Uncharacterized protein n=1 Tax=Vitis vinifera TaxID=29760 RepID=A0ABY9CWX2_VITVI|nr:hypothetical protein VitviT2T_018088 [Vitis vinifera]